MKVIIAGENKEAKSLFELVNESIEDLGLNEFVKPELLNSNDEIEKYKQNVEIKKFPALIIEEESIDFKDVIFEGFTPEKSELTQMFVSIIGGTETGGGCGSEGGCGSCASNESCGI